MGSDKRVRLKRTEDYYIKVLLSQIVIREIMTTPVITIDIESNFQEVARIFDRHHIRHLPVIGGDRKLVGLISQRDLFRVCPPNRTPEGEFVYDMDSLNGIILKHVMVRAPFFMREDQCIGEAAVHFVEKQYGCIPIVNQEMQIVGIVTQEDILRIAVEIYQEGDH